MQITIHGPSALAGAGILALTFLVGGASQQATKIGRVAPSSDVRVVGVPDPREMVQIREGSPFTVPVGRLFVLTALGSDGVNNSSDSTSLTIDGQQELAVIRPSSTGNGTERSECSLRPVTSGLTVPAGSVVEVHATPAPGQGRAWGYLVDA